MECDEVQTFPLDLGIEKEFNHATISDNTCAKNIKSEDNLVCSKQEVISPTNFDTPCIVSANQEFYLSPNLIYTSQSQELLPSCDISYSSNYNNEICSNELIYAGSHLESDVKHLNLNSTHLQGNSDEPPEKQSSSDFSLAKTPIENYDPSLKNMTLLDCSTNKCSNFKNSDLEFNTESLNSSALFPTDGQKSFNLLSSTFIENCEDNSNDTNFSSESFQEPNSQSSSIEATNLKENYMDVTKEDSLYFCNNNNNNIDNVMSRGGRILKMKRWWNTDADAETVKSDDRKDQIISDYQNSFVDNDSNSLKESNLKPRKKRGRKKGVKRMIMEENSENNERPHWKQCIWIANIIPSAMRNNNSLECGKCAKVFSSVQTFKSHAYSSHNGLVRLKGDSQEFDEPLLNEILSIVFKVKKKLICSECKKSFKSLVGYKYHSERCGKTEADFYSFCKICNKKLLSTSIETHEKNHDNKIRLKAEKKLLEMKRKNLENDDDLEKSVGRTPRKAAKYCHDQMKLLYGSIDSEYDDSADKDFIEEEVDKYFYSNEFKSPDKSHKFDEFNKNILKFGESKCLTIGCDLIFKDIKQLKLHLRTCSSHYVTCKLCLSTIKRININEHLEECRKDDASNDSDDLSDVDEHDSVIDSCKTSKVLTVRFKQYQYSKEMTKQFRKINYSDRLYTTLICHSIDWIAVNDDDLYLYQSRLPHSPLFSLLKNSSDKDISWEKIQNLKGNVLDSSEIFFAGGSIRSVAWCPIPVMNNEPSQYIAVSCTNNPDQSCPINKSEKHNGLLQIWHCGNLTKPEIPELSLGIAHENGVIWSMEWCPSGIYEDPYANSLEDSVIKRLGLLAAAFSDGIIRVYLIPHPYQIASKNKIFKKNPEFSLCPYDYENLDLQCVKVSWCASKNHSLIAGSFTNGMVCIWNLNCTSTLLSFQDSEGGTKLYPINSISAHNGVCSAVSFFPKTEGRHIVTGGYDRTIKFWDLMQPEHPLNVIKKGIVTDSVWLPHWAGAFFSFDDAYSLGKTTTTFRENGFYGSTFRSVLGTNATVWSISGSDWLNAIVQADEAGEVILSLQHNLNCEIQGEKHMSKKRFPLFSAKIEKVKNEKIFCDESSQLSNEKTSFENNIPQTYNDTNESSPELFMEQPLTYAASMENYGIKFYDEDYQDPSKLDEISIRSKQCSELMEPGPLTQYPLMGGSSVSWNNNYGTHTWICVGFHSGLVRIVQIPRLE